jgi:caffeoyl-CoA O-methyltransferase
MPYNLDYYKVNDYISSLVPDRHPEILKMEKIGRENKFPIIGPAVGYFCYQIARMIGAKRIFELGSGYGYSTAWFAKAVSENGGGEIHHTVWDADLSKQAEGHLTNLGYHDLVTFHVREAVDALRSTDGPFDLIFNDIDKYGYPESLPVIESKLRPGGVLIIDNMLWDGRIFEGDNSRDTVGVMEFTRMIMQSPNWIATLVPIRDGVILGYKK